MPRCSLRCINSFSHIDFLSIENGHAQPAQPFTIVNDYVFIFILSIGSGFFTRVVHCHVDNLFPFKENGGQCLDYIKGGGGGDKVLFLTCTAVKGDGRGGSVR